MITALCRTVILYLLLTVGLRLMGKRQIGQLEPSELVLALVLSDLASVPMQDFGIPLLNGLLPMATLLSLSMLISFFNLKSLRFRSLLCGEPALIIRDGVILQSAMARNRLTVDELLEQLRCQGYFDLQSIRCAVLETGGQLSVLPREDAAPLTLRSLSGEEKAALPIPIISDGRLLERGLSAAGRDRVWLDRQLRAHGIASCRRVFLMTVDTAGAVTLIKKEPLR